MTWQEVSAARARRGMIEVGVISASAATRHIVTMHEVRHSDARVLPGWWGYLPETDTVYWAVNRGLAEEGWRAAKATYLNGQALTVPRDVEQTDYDPRSGRFVRTHGVEVTINGVSVLLMRPNTKDWDGETYP